jgi:PAS domain S-box-containing protein
MLRKITLGVRGKTSLGLGFLIFTSLFIASEFSYWKSRVYAEQNIISLKQISLERLSYQITTILISERESLLALRDVPPVTAMIRSRNAGGIDPLRGGTLGQWKKRLEDIFLSYTLNSQSYAQLKFIDVNGNELVRVDSLTGKAAVADDLQNQKDNLYVSETLKLPAGKLYYSDVNLNRENGVIQQPLTPILRIATPVYLQENDQVQGLIVVNIYVEDLFKNIFAESSGVKRFVSDAQGQYLKHSDTSKLFGKALGTDYNLSQDDPQLLDLSKQHDSVMRYDAEHDEVAGFQKIFFSPSDHNRYWLLGINTPQAIAFAPLIAERNDSLLAGAFFGLLALLGTLWMTTRNIVTPVVRLAEIAKKMQQGDMVIRADPESVKDEFRLLYEMFNDFAANQQLIKADLEADILLKTQRYALVIDSLIDSLITLNKTGTIESFNPASERIFGYLKGEVIGQNINLLIPGSYHSEANNYLLKHIYTYEKQTIGIGREMIGRRKDGSTFVMELAVSELNVGEELHFTGIVRDISDRKIAEQNVLDEKARLLAVINNVVDGIITINEKGFIETFNPAAARIFGYSPDEAIGQKLKSLMPALKHDAYDNYLANYVSNDEDRLIGQVLESIGVRKDCTTFAMEMAVSSLLIGEQHHFAAIVRDITERQTDAQNVLDEKARLLAVIDNVVDGIITINEKGFIETFNPAAARIFGYSPDEAIGQKLKSLMPAPNHAAYDDYLSNYVSNDEDKVRGQVLESVGVHKDSSTFAIEMAVSTLLIGEQRHFAAIVRDITERQTDAQNVLDEKARLLAVIDNVVDGIITINEKGFIETFNPAAARIFGYSPDEAIGQSVKLLMPESDHREYDDYLLNHVSIDAQRVKGVGLEIIGLRKDGTTFPMEMALSTLLIGDQSHFAGIVRDITERKRVEQMQKEFISTVSHELRTPLTSIRGSLGLILGGVVGELPEKVHDLLAIANNNSERLITLINDILDVEKITAGMMDFDYTVTNLIPVIKKALESNKGYGDQLNVKFIFEQGENERVIVRIDEKRIDQVMSNLLSNAAKNSPTGDHVDIMVTTSKGQAHIAVHDHGKGIPEKFKSRIFSKFAQADSSDTRQKGGTGLGLSITKGIVEQHGGSVHFDSSPDKGTTFYVDLALYEETHKVDIDSDKGHSDRPLLLVVEDEPDVSKLLVMLLENGGYECHQAFDYQDAVKKIQSHHYDAVTLDLMIPGGSGINLLRQMRADKATRMLPVIVVSAKANQGKLEIKGEVLKKVDWIEKPINEELLLKTVQSSLAPEHDKVSILHVEDDLDIAMIINTQLSPEYQVQHATTLTQARHLLRDEYFDLVILDIGLPDGSGEDLLPLLNSPQHQTPVIIFTAQDISEDLAAQVEGAVVKTKMAPETLMQHIKSVINKETIHRVDK